VSRPGAFALLVLLLAPAFVPPVPAEHEIYYRYVVLGFVKDAQGRPVAGRELELIRDKTGFSYLGLTDDAGFFLIVARLGDESAGESLTLRAGTTATRLVAVFDPANHTEHRGARVDLEGARFVEQRAGFQATLLDALGAATR
jgi:hypothetical protein